MGNFLGPVRVGTSDAERKSTRADEVIVEGDDHLEGVPLAMNVRSEALKRTVIFDSEDAD